MELYKCVNQFQIENAAVWILPYKPDDDDPGLCGNKVYVYEGKKHIANNGAIFVNTQYYTIGFDVLLSTEDRKEIEKMVANLVQLFSQELFVKPFLEFNNQ
jgi:hypothetical protein